MTPTLEQEAIVDFAKREKRSLLINALAGAAKTTTLELIAKALPSQPILSLAFNKRIAEEMKKRLPGHVDCRTLNALGHRVWGTATGRRLVIDTKKTYTIASAVVKELPSHQRAEFYEESSMGELLKAVGAAKMAGYIPGDFHVNGLITKDEWLEGFEEDPPAALISAIEECLRRSIAAAYDGGIDFDDQIYMPTLFGGTFPRFPLVMVDEAQDLSPLNHAMLRKLVTNRLIAVGDPWQSIYAFRGAMTSSMAVLRDTFDMHEMTLSVSFRCPRKVVERAWFRVPFMKWFDGAQDGEVETIRDWGVANVPDGAAIICRNNAPLFRTAMAFLKAGRGVQVVGADIGPGLVKILRKLGPETLSKEQANVEINKWEAERLAKSRAKASVSDRADCLRVFVSFGDTLRDAIAYAEHLFKQQGPVQLLSGHKSKGLEWDTVFHLDPWRIPSSYAVSPEEREQELNVRYVIETRAKRALYLVNAEDFA